MRRLYRSRDERMVTGVASGIAEYFSIDPTLARLAFVAFTLAAGGIGLVAYALLSILLPLEPVPGMVREEAMAAPMPHTPAEEETRREAQESQVPQFRR